MRMGEKKNANKYPKASFNNAHGAKLKQAECESGVLAMDLIRADIPRSKYGRAEGQS